MSKLKLHLDKTEVLLVWKSITQVLDYPSILNGVAVPLWEQVCSLGVVLDPQVLLTSWQLWPEGLLPSQLDLAMVIHALVACHLKQYALYVGLP